MTLKTYSIASDFTSGVIEAQLHNEIIADGSVTDFVGLSSLGDSLLIEGASMNEAGLDAVIAAHVPNYVAIVIRNTVQENKVFADNLIQRLKEKNVLEGLNSLDQSAWVHHRMRKIDYTLSDTTTVVQLDLMNLVVSGDIETAEQALGQMVPDDMTETYHWLTQVRIDWIRNEIRAYLGWPLL